MISKKTVALRRLTAHLEAVAYTSEVPGFGDMTLDGKVFRGRTVFGDEVVPPFLAILEAPRQLITEGRGESKTTLKYDWKLLIHGFAPDYKKHPTDPAYELAAHVEARMARLIAQERSGAGPTYPDEFKLGRIVEDILFTNPIVRPPDNDVSDTAYFYMPVTLEFVTDMVSPFTEE
jgi:hypothetical protein